MVEGPGCKLKGIKIKAKLLKQTVKDVSGNSVEKSFNNNQQVDSETGGKTETPTLELLMSGDLLTFRNSAAEIRPSVTCRMKYEELNNLDICSPVFNFKRAYSLFREQHNRLVCDVLLDQFILPGVGNIINNEGADEQFPICAGHGQPCTIRNVMKIGPNNGGRFFTCKLPKNKQCKFFEWAEGYD